MVDASGRVRVDDLQSVVGAGEGVAEAGDVDAGELEFGGGVEAGEGRGAAVQPVRDDFRHRVRRRYQAQTHAAEIGHFADRPDPGDLGAAVLADHDAAARAESELLRPAVAGPEQLVAGPHADGGDDDVGVDHPPVGQQHAGDPAGVVGEHLGGEHAAVDGEALGLDQPAEGLPGALVQLGVHQPGGAVDDDRVGAELGGAGRRLQAQQPAADGDGVDRAAQGRGEVRDFGVDGPDVLQRAVDVGVFGARDGQAGRVRAGRDHQLVVGVDGAGGGLHGFRGGVDGGGALAGPEGERPVAPQGGLAQGEVHGGIRQRLAQRHPVVGQVGLLRQHGDLPAGQATGVHGLHETVGCGAAAGDDDAARRGGCGGGGAGAGGLSGHGWPFVGPQAVCCNISGQPRQRQFRVSFPNVSWS
ncbi:hypothetical protein QWJ39_14160 [Arthrobacter sp. YD4]|nr:hypothetical protein [Arthrobacter sp. YD4]MDN3937450.1 hypothetical protein [Arthrobacter sp. YD4]